MARDFVKNKTKKNQNRKFAICNLKAINNNTIKSENNK